VVYKILKDQYDLSMNGDKIRQMYLLHAQARKLDDKALKAPENQAALKALAELDAEYLEWFRAVNDKAEMEKYEEKMELKDALALLQEAVSVFLQVPVQRKASEDEYVKALSLLALKASEQQGAEEKEN